MAVLLFNLRGPDAPESLRPVRVHLFTDPAFLRLPAFVRPWPGRIIAWARTKLASENYAIIGGESPLLEFTLGQGTSLKAALNAPGDIEAKACFGMRHWHPMSGETGTATCSASIWRGANEATAAVLCAVFG